LGNRQQAAGVGGFPAAGNDKGIGLVKEFPQAVLPFSGGAANGLGDFQAGEKRRNGLANSQVLFSANGCLGDKRRFNTGGLGIQAGGIFPRFGGGIGNGVKAAAAYQRMPVISAWDSSPARKIR